MIQVQDLPESDDEGEDEDAESAEEEEEEDQKDGDGPPKEPDGPLDEEAFQKQMAERMEALRLSRALGNDDPDELEHPPPDDTPDSDSETESDISDGPPVTEYSTASSYRPRRHRAPLPISKLEEIDELKSVVAKQVGRERELKERVHARKAPNKAGNVKGHKWRKSSDHIVGSTSEW